MSKKGYQEKTLKDCISNMEHLEEYLREKGKNHNYYKWYSSLKSFQDILQNGYIYFSSGNKWNDLNDQKAFNSSSYDSWNYGRCFSFSKSENVAMWMLYGGVQSEGAMLSLTKKDMQDFVSSIKQVEALIGEDYITIPISDNDIYLIDMLYFGASRKGDRKYDIKRSDESIRSAISDTFFVRNCLWKKKYPWNYENECRLVISLEKTRLPKQPEKIRVCLSEETRTAWAERIKHSPNYSGEKIFDSSILAGDMSWDLCVECRKD